MAVARAVTALAVPAMDLAFMRGIAAGLDRPRVFFSDIELAAIKRAATQEGSWISTQEALSAYLLVVVGRALLPADSPGRVAATFVLDARKALGHDAEETCGGGLVFATVRFEGLLQMSLPEVAGVLHERAQSELSQKEIGRMWRIMAGCSQAGYHFAPMPKFMPSGSEHDLFLMLNNQSKRELPDFGEAGRAESVVTSAGPTLFLPAPGGIEVFMDKASLLSAARTEVEREHVVAELRACLPESA